MSPRLHSTVTFVQEEALTDFIATFTHSIFGGSHDIKDLVREIGGQHQSDLNECKVLKMFKVSLSPF